MAQMVNVRGETLAVNIFEPTTKHHSDVLLIHGFTGSKEDFSDIAPLIAESGFRVLTFDNRGQNESSYSTRVDGYSMESLGRDALEIAKYFEFKRPHLLGHSFGGLIAQQAVMIEPNYWSSLTLMCSGPGGRPEWLDEPQFEDLNNDTKASIWKDVLEADRLGNAKFELWKKRWLASDADSTMAFREHLKKQPSLIDEIAKQKIRSHVLYGENDDAWPLKDQDEMAHDLNASLTVLPNCGHCPNEEDPELLTRELVAFWKSG